MSNAQQEQLLIRAKSLDKDALVEIYDLYSDALFAYAYKQLGDAEVAEDLVSETFYRFLGAIERGGGPEDHLRAYLYRITHNLINDHFRQKSPPTLELKEERIPEEKPGPPSRLIHKQDVERIRSALRLLTAEQRQVVVLRFLEGWSSQEIAKAMNKSLGAIKALQHRGLAALKRILIDQDQPIP
jgi:RNA polymerase sigma-70 factor (ECF subfamily)